jgi:polyisoprenoid-binding protein YceI
MRSAFLALLVVMGVSTARGADLYESERDQVLATYEASLGTHRVTGTSGSLEWRILKLDDGESHVRLVMQVDSFGSGSPALDSALRNALDSGRFPTVEIEGIARASDSSLRGTITVHGVSRPLIATLTMTRVGARLLVQTSVTVALDSFGILAPAVASQRIGNFVEVSVLGRLHVHPDSVLSGGALGSTD